MAGKSKSAASSVNRSNGHVPQTQKGKPHSSKGHKKLKGNLVDKKNTKAATFDSQKVGYYCLVFALGMLALVAF